MWQPILEGERIRARPLADSDFDALFAAASDPLIWEQHPDRLRHTRERFEAYFRSGLDSGGALLLTDRATGEVLGSSRYHDYRPAERRVEVGYTFLIRRCWGGAYNGELKRLMLDHAFLHVDTVVFQIGPGNLRSRRAVEKLGAVRVPSERPDAVTYALAKAARTPSLRASPKS